MDLRCCVRRNSLPHPSSTTYKPLPALPQKHMLALYIYITCHSTPSHLCAYRLANYETLIEYSYAPNSKQPWCIKNKNLQPTALSLNYYVAVVRGISSLTFAYSGSCSMDFKAFMPNTLCCCIKDVIGDFTHPIAARAAAAFTFKTVGRTELIARQGY